jgi:hypothetical protein
MVFEFLNVTSYLKQNKNTKKKKESWGWFGNPIWLRGGKPLLYKKNSELLFTLNYFQIKNQVLRDCLDICELILKKFV